MKSVNLKKNTVFLIFLIVSDCFARLSFVVFPFENLSNDDVYSWISAIIPEAAYRSMFTSEEMRLYDPVFIFQTDSSAWKMNSDSLIQAHKARWKWDAAIGGNYSVIRDSVYFTVKICWSVDSLKIENIEFNGAERISKCQELCFNLLKKVFISVNVPFPEDKTDSKTMLFNYSKTAGETYIAGYLFEMRGNIAAASSAYSRALEIEPELVFAGCHLGRMLFLQKKDNAARKLYEQILSKHPDDPMVSAFMIESMGSSEDPQDALLIAAKLKKTLAKSSKGLSASGYLHLRMGETHRAISLLSQAKALGTDNLDTEFYLGQAMLQAGDYDRAIDIFNKLIRVRPDFLKYYSSLGAAYKKSGQLMQASIAMQTALSKDNHDISIMIDLSQIWIELKWFQKALHILEEASKINPDIPSIHINRAIALWQTGNISEAKKILTKSTEYTSVKASALTNLGNISFHEKDYRRALSFYRKALSLGMQNQSLEFDIALCYQKIGKKKRALYHYDQFLSVSSGNNDVLQRCAELSIEIKKYDDAIIYLKRILENSPQEKNAVKKLSDIFISQGKYDEAINTIEVHLLQSPSSKDLKILLADVYISKKWIDVALPIYQEIISDFPELPDGYLGLGKCMIEQIKNGQRSDIDNAITTLKFASERAPKDPESEILLGDLYLTYKNDTKSANEYWKSALAKTNDNKVRKKILKKRNSLQ